MGGQRHLILRVFHGVAAGAHAHRPDAEGLAGQDDVGLVAQGQQRAFNAAGAGTRHVHGIVGGKGTQRYGGYFHGSAFGFIVAGAVGHAEQVQHIGKQGIHGFFGAAGAAGQREDEGLVPVAGHSPAHHGIGHALLSIAAGGFHDAGHLAVQEGTHGVGCYIPRTESGAAGEDQHVHGLGIAEVFGFGGNVGGFIGDDAVLGGADAVLFQPADDGLAGLVFLASGGDGIGADDDGGAQFTPGNVGIVGFTALFAQQADVADFHALVDGLEHIVDGEGGDGCAVHGFHLHAGAVDGFHLHADADALFGELAQHLAGFHGQRVAIGNDVAGIFNGQQGGGAGKFKDIPLGHGLLPDGLQGSRRSHGHLRPGHRHTQGLNLGGNVVHGAKIRDWAM